MSYYSAEAEKYGHQGPDPLTSFWQWLNQPSGVGAFLDWNPLSGMPTLDEDLRTHANQQYVTLPTRGGQIQVPNPYYRPPQSQVDPPSTPSPATGTGTPGTGLPPGAIPGVTYAPAATGAASYSTTQIEQMIRTSAAAYGVDPNLALAIAYQESGLNPNAVGDNGTSFGLFQLHQGGLLGSLNPQDVMSKPQLNIDRALSNLQMVMRANPNASPGQLAALAQRPADPTSYANGINQIFNAYTNNTALPQVRTLPDGTKLTEGTPEFSLYNDADSIWYNIYGPYSHPPMSIINAMKQAGITDTMQIQSVFNSMPTHIPGVNAGQYQTMKQAADQASQKYFGHAASDAVVKMLAGQGITNADDINTWYLMHPANEIPKDDYKAIWDIANQYTQGVSGTTATPDHVSHLYQKVAEAPVNNVRQREPRVGGAGPRMVA